MSHRDLFPQEGSIPQITFILLRLIARLNIRIKEPIRHYQSWEKLFEQNNVKKWFKW